MQGQEHHLREPLVQLPTADHRRRPHGGAHRAVRAVDVQPFEKAVVHRDAIVNQAAYDERDGGLGHGAIGIERPRALPGGPGDVQPHVAVTDRHLDLEPDRLIAHAVIVAKAFSLVLALG